MDIKIANRSLENAENDRIARKIAQQRESNHSLAVAFAKTKEVYGNT